MTIHLSLIKNNYIYTGNKTHFLYPLSIDIRATVEETAHSKILLFWKDVCILYWTCGYESF